MKQGCFVGFDRSYHIPLGCNGLDRPERCVLFNRGVYFLEGFADLGADRLPALQYLSKLLRVVPAVQLTFVVYRGSPNFLFLHGTGCLSYRTVQYIVIEAFWYYTTSQPMRTAWRVARFFFILGFF